MVKALTDQTFERATAHGVTLTDFWAEWCGPCRMQSPVIEDLDRDLAGKVAISKVDVDHNAATAAKFDIMSIPTLLIKKDGRVVEKLVGLRTKHQLKAVLAKYTTLEETN
ncbi:thioredoxin [Lactiplantibacillus modestisalitolerans]|uniref:Thioredoxin n=1 Tax=Lactiplantibacillus modestisalitolerans TaxID=1457219 RepID=A0ABV5WRH9_9LACO|nr:thioredoxin [Lactiplantibacillus modestisalitolerans]